jgi:hypothetical protein
MSDAAAFAEAYAALKELEKRWIARRDAARAAREIEVKKGSDTK